MTAAAELRGEGTLPQSILIADSDEERAERIAGVCADHGFGARIVHDGAAALESALADLPDLIVATLRLPLIGGARLTEILRANPRTRSVRFVLLGDGHRAAASAGPGDRVLPLPLDEQELGRRIDQIAARRSRLGAFERDVGGDHQVSGQLSQIPLPDLLQLFHVNRRTGRLDLSRGEPGGRDLHGRIHLRDGDVVQAAAGPVEGEKAFFRLLGWKTGSFAFTAERARVPVRIETPTRALLMEGLRQLDEWENLSGSLPAPDAQVSLRVQSADLPNMVHPLTQEVLLLLELYGRVQDVVDHCSYPDYQVLRTLQTLIERGIVKARWGPTPVPPAPQDALFSPAHVRRLHEWLEQSRGRGHGRGDAKVLLAASEPGGVHDFVRLLEGLPGLHVPEPFAEGRIAHADLATAARIAVGGEAGLELIQVPARPADAPLWPLVAHGALGTILLISGALGEAGRVLRPLESSLRRLPRARLLHTVLLGKGERPLPEELRENLSLLDDASLFLVPSESGREALPILRRLLHRVLP